MESGSGGFSPGAALRAATRGCARTRLGHSWRKSSRVFPEPAGKCRFPFPYWLASRVPEARHCQSKVAGLSYFAEDRGLGLPELTPLASAAARSRLKSSREQRRGRKLPARGDEDVGGQLADPVHVQVAITHVALHGLTDSLSVLSNRAGVVRKGTITTPPTDLLLVLQAHNLCGFADGQVGG